MANLRDPVSKRPPDILLQMDHWVEELSPAQQLYYSRAEKECSEILSRVNDLIKKDGGELLEKGQDIMVVQTTGSAPVPSLSSIMTSAAQSALGPGSNNRPSQRQQHSQPPVPNIQAVSSPQLLIQSAPVQAPGRNTRATPGQVPTFPQASGTFQLVMDPRLGLIVGAVPNQQQPSGNPIVQATTVPQPVQPTQVQQVTPSRGRSTATTGAPPPPPPRAVVNKAPATTAGSNIGRILLPTITSGTTTVTTNRTKSKTTAASSPAISSTINTPTIPASSNRPTENNSVGGLSAGSPCKRTVQEEGKGNGPDSREVTFNKMSGKTFPSLVVGARPHLRNKDMVQSKVNQERSALDGKVKSVLMFTPTKFTEWLIQQGLVRSEQYCGIHRNASGPVKLKLGMYSDVTKFPYSGGYVWISECCPQRFVSVFSGSIFEGAPHPPTVLLKLMYHWCCQTSVQNVVQWVKVDNFYLKNFFTHMRSVCVSAVHELHEKLGGLQRKVEVGVISLGTTSQDGNMRQVKVEVLGVMDPDSKLVRLRAVEPLQDGERNYKRRFVKILEPLEQWVHKDSIIITDFTVDKGTLQSMGFNQVHQSTIPDAPSQGSTLTNQNIMEYLRRIVPRMFQNTLSLLSRQIIQQFLDELVWRERWGPVPSQAFDSLVTHLSAQTKLDSGESLLVKLGKIAGNPFRKWEYGHWENNGLSATGFSAPPIVANSSQTTSSRTYNISSNKSGAGPQKKTSDNDVVEVETSVEATNYKTSIALQAPYEQKHEEEVELRVARAVDKIDKGMSLRKAVELFKVPRSLLMERALHVLKNKRAIGPMVFSLDEENDIVDHLFRLYEWGYPFGRWDIRLVVKQYLDCCGRNEQKFKENFPGDLWIEKFLTRHPEVRAKLCRNIPSRGTFVDSDSVHQFILNLSSALTGVPAENIVNFMEVGLTGDPLRSMTVELRDLRYPVGKRRVKSSSAIMLSCTATGKMLPTYIVFEGKSVFISKGPAPGEYYGTKCGWFDECAFQQWLESVLIPWADGRPGRKVVVGDSLAQLFTVQTQALCVDKEITFVCMPCNVTSVLSPLDVTLFEKLKSQWRVLIRSWASANGDKFISQEDFPGHIHELLCSTIGPDVPELLRASFKQVGLHPFVAKSTMLALESGGINLNDKDTPKQVDQYNEKKGRKRASSGDLISHSKRNLKEGDCTDVQEKEVDYQDRLKNRELYLHSIEEALQHSRELGSLEEYYYGTKSCDQDLVDREFKMENINAKCPLCQTFVPTNLDLMKHILGHSEQSPTLGELSTLIQCRYCVQNFRTPEDLDVHTNEVHRNFNTPLVCLICNEKFLSRPKLILHMHNIHTNLELPYQCSICFYRSSQQYKLVDHFYEVHAGGEKVQCPFCLKCVAVGSNGKKMPANTFFFMHHVRKHQAKASARRCDKCALWFVHKGILKEHQVKDHVSFKNDPAVTPYSREKIDGVMMPLPGFPLSSVNDKTGSNFTQKPFDNVDISCLVPSFVCLECNSSFSQEHFQGYMSCLRCAFSSCCNNAMTKHIKVFHCKDRPYPTPDALFRLPEKMFCACGFSSRNGNLLATHLILCCRKTAYGSAVGVKDRAVSSQSASFPPLVTLDENDHAGDVRAKWKSLKALSGRNGNDFLTKERSDKQCLEQPSMLNVLGLVRKSSVDEPSDKPVSPVLVEEENNKERPSSRGSNSSRGSRRKKRSADEAGLAVNECEEEKSVYENSTANPYNAETLLSTGNSPGTQPKETSQCQVSGLVTEPMPQIHLAGE